MRDVCKEEKGSTGKYHFNLVVPNGHVIATSGSYKSKEAALNGIESVKRNAPNAEVHDQPAIGLPCPVAASAW
jgi:uncharacterized protein